MKLLLLAAMLGILPAQAPQPRPGTIEGTVLRLGLQDPIVGASVVLQASQFGPRRSTTTDGNGRFSFTDMAPGVYALVAEREGYLAGSDGPFTTTVAISTVIVTEGATARVAFELLRPSVIRGRIADQDGNAKAGLSVDLLRIVYDVLGRAKAELRKRAVTNERGDYEFSGLIPGDHYIRAGHLPSLDVRSNAGNARVTYYPGTPDPAAAAPIVLKQGDELSANFKQHEQDAYTVRGRVINLLPSSANSPRLQLRLLPRTPSSPLDSPTPLNLPQESDGTFEISGVAPGTYDLAVIGEIWTRDVNGRGLGTLTLSAQHVSRIPIQVRNQDIENVSLTLKAGVEVHGRLILQEGDGQRIRFGAPFVLPAVRTEPGAATSTQVIPRGQSPNDLRLSLVRKDMDSQSITLNASNTEGTASTAVNVSEGEYAVKVMSNLLRPFSTYVADIRSGARSVLTEGFTVGSEPVTLDVMVRSDGGTIEGSLSATEKASVLLVLIPSSQRRNNLSLYSSVTMYSSGTTQSAASFRLHGIAPGEYKLFAWEGADGINASQPYVNADYIARYETRGVPVKVEANSTVTGIKVVAIPMGQ